MASFLSKFATVAALGFVTAVVPQVSAAKAESILNCAELDYAISDIDVISDGVFFRDSVRSGSKLDDELERIVDVAQRVADIEDDNNLYRATDRLEDAWIDEDWDAYSDALDDMADRLEYFYNRDC